MPCGGARALTFDGACRIPQAYANIIAERNQCIDNPFVTIGTVGVLNQAEMICCCRFAEVVVIKSQRIAMRDLWQLQLRDETAALDSTKNQPCRCLDRP